MKSTDDTFEPAEIEIILFSTEDVITTSFNAEEHILPGSAEDILNMCME